MARREIIHDREGIKNWMVRQKINEIEMKKIIISLSILLLLGYGNHSFAQQGIGTDIPDKSSVLDIVSTDKGILVPRVVLNTVDQDLDGIDGQASGLMVYNTGEGNLSKGYYFWNGTEWRTLDDRTAVAPEIASLLCASASLEPAVLKQGEPYTGIMRVAYTGGNGGSYQGGGEIASVGNTGLTATLKSGSLEYGNGFLIYDVVGTPSASSPTGAAFDITFGTTDVISCTAKVGETSSARIDDYATIGPLFATNENGRQGYHRFVTTPDGKFSVRVFVPQNSSLGLSDIQIRSNTGPVTIMWNADVTYRGGNLGNASNRFSLTEAGVWYGTSGENGDSPDSGLNAGWGNPDVYYGAPEQRSYMWTSDDTSDQTTYILKFMMGAPNDGLQANDTNISETKATLYITQIKAAD